MAWLEATGQSRVRRASPGGSSRRLFASVDLMQQVNILRIWGARFLMSEKRIRIWKERTRMKLVVIGLNLIHTHTHTQILTSYVH